MFSHSGQKLKVIAWVLFILGAVVSVALAVVLLSHGAFRLTLGTLVLKVSKKMSLFLSMGVLLGGAALSYICALMVYGFGELVHKTRENNYLLSRLASHVKNIDGEMRMPH